jgi:peptidoglycan hydrolase-like protein with peptidoglycan-binding domain
VTGYYGRLTARQVRRFQAAHGIRGTGQVGPLTWPTLLGDGSRPAGVVYLTFDDGPTPAHTPPPTRSWSARSTPPGTGSATTPGATGG